MQTIVAKPIFQLVALAACLWTTTGCITPAFSGDPASQSIQAAQRLSMSEYGLSGAGASKTDLGSKTPEIPTAPAALANTNLPARSGRQMVYSARFQVSTAHEEDAIRRLTSTVVGMGGYLESREDSRVVCRVPATRFGELVDLIPTWGSILSQSIRSQDETRNYQDLRLRIETAEASRRRVLALLDRAEKVEDILKLETELRKLVEMIEQAQGKSRTLAEQIAYSHVEVHFRPHRAQIASGREATPSPFAWINRVGIEQVIDGFGSVTATGPSLKSGAQALIPGGIPFDPPEGFLVVRHDRDQLKGITPDESKLWIRRFEAPRQGTLAFWSRALKNHLVNHRGYKLLEEVPVKDKQGAQGIQLRFEAASQGRPHHYLIALYVVEGPFWSSASTIRVVQFVAPKQSFEKYVAAVRSSTTMR